jgi:chromosomal replication initiation ATPase DnaA
MRGQMTKAAFNSYLAGTYALARDDGILHVAVGDPLTQDWIEQRLAAKVLSAVQGVDGTVNEVVYESERSTK